MKLESLALWFIATTDIISLALVLLLSLTPTIASYLMWFVGMKLIFLFVMLSKCKEKVE